MKQQSVRQVGTVKKRQYAKYAIHVQHENEYAALVGIFAISRHQKVDTVKKWNYYYYTLAMCLFAEEVEQIPRVETEKVERRYLRYLDADLRGRFTVNFRFRRDDFLDYCGVLKLQCTLN